jgi:1,4-alpha-glucan branching enzyme
MLTAVNGAYLAGATRTFAVARSRLCSGLAVLSAGTPMFMVGEAIGAQKDFTYNGFLANREAILGERTGTGQAMFRFDQARIARSHRLPSIRSHNIAILHHSNTNRVIAFKRWGASEEVLVLASFNHVPFANGYRIEKDELGIPDAGWKAIFSSDAAIDGGQNTGNGGAVRRSTRGQLNATIPGNGFVVLIKVFFGKWSTVLYLGMETTTLGVQVTTFKRCPLLGTPFREY